MYRIKYNVSRDGVTVPAGALVERIGFRRASLLHPDMARIRHGENELYVTLDCLES